MDTIQCGYCLNIIHIHCYDSNNVHDTISKAIIQVRDIIWRYTLLTLKKHLMPLYKPHSLQDFGKQLQPECGKQDKYWLPKIYRVANQIDDQFINNLRPHKNDLALSRHHVEPNTPDANHVFSMFNIHVSKCHKKALFLTFGSQSIKAYQMNVKGYRDSSYIFRVKYLDKCSHRKMQYTRNTIKLTLTVEPNN